MPTMYDAQSFYETTLAKAIGTTDTTIQVTTAPSETAGYLVLEPKSSNREIILYTGVSGTSLTGCTRGLGTTGFLDTAGTGLSHPAGAEVGMKDVHYYLNKVNAVFTGTSASGYNTWKMGDGAAVSSADRLWYAQTSSVSAFWGLSSSGKMVVSEDGSTSYVISAGGSGVTAGNGIDITAGSVSLDNLSSGALGLSGTKNVITLSGTTLARNASGLYVDYATQGPTLEQLSGALASETSAFFNSTDITGAQAETLTDGSDSDSLHTHASLTLKTDTATASHDMSVTGTQVISHGLGSTPKMIEFSGIFDVDTFSEGAWDGSTNACVAIAAGGSVPTAYAQAIHYLSPVTTFAYATVTGATTTTFTLTWAKTGAPTGTHPFLWKAFV